MPARTPPTTAAAERKKDNPVISGVTDLVQSVNRAMMSRMPADFQRMHGAKKPPRKPKPRKKEGY